MSNKINGLFKLLSVAVHGGHYLSIDCSRYEQLHALMNNERIMFGCRNSLVISCENVFSVIMLF